MSVRLDFDPETVPEGDGQFELLLPGMYTAQIIESDLVPTKSGSGEMLKLTFEIIEGPLSRRRVWENLNIVNRSEDAQAIAQRALKKICEAVGHTGPLHDSRDIEFKPLRIRVAVEADKTGQWGDNNRIKAYEALRGAPQTTAQASRPAPAQTEAAEPRQAAAAGQTRPWGNRR